MEGYFPQNPTNSTRPQDTMTTSVRLDQMKARLRDYAACIEKVRQSEVQKAQNQRSQEIGRLLEAVETYNTKYVKTEKEIRQKEEKLVNILNTAINSNAYSSDEVVEHILRSPYASPSEELARGLLERESSGPKPPAPRKTSQEFLAVFERENLRNPLEAGKALLQAAKLCQTQKKPQEALSHYCNALPYLESDPHLWVDTAIDLGSLYQRQEKVEEAINCFHQAAAREENSQSPRASALFLAYKQGAASLRFSKRYDEAINCLNYALHYAKQCNDQNFFIQLYNMSSTTYKAMGNFAQAHHDSRVVLQTRLQQAENNPLQAAKAWLAYAKSNQAFEEFRDQVIDGYKQYLLELLKVPSLSANDKKEKRAAITKLQALTNAESN